MGEILGSLQLCDPCELWASLARQPIDRAASSSVGRAFLHGYREGRWTSAEGTDARGYTAGRSQGYIIYSF
ncbi:MAG: hypothetical protein ACYDHX_09225 [Methanothrix sp.]